MMEVERRRDIEAIALLRAACGPDGIAASMSTVATSDYRAVFARDAVMAGMAGLLLGDDVVSQGLVRTLEGLRELQGPEGQIASNFERRANAAPRVSFGSLAPRIDSATWYLIGIDCGAQKGVLDPESYRASATRVVRLLDAIEYNGRHLMYIPTGGNWADEYIYDGYILYDQVLRAWALRRLGALYSEPTWIAKATAIGETIDARYWLDPARMTGHPMASFTPLGPQTMFDLAACSLLALSGVAPTLGAAALTWIDDTFLKAGRLPPAFAPVIDEAHPSWPALRRYHLHEFRNAPHKYHNGGIWPIWLGWLALALGHTARHDALGRLRALADARLGDEAVFAFEEYLHGVTGVPGGAAQMAYSATGLIFLPRADSSAASSLFSR